MGNHNAEYLSGLVKKFGKSLVLQRMLLFFLKMTTKKGHPFWMSFFLVEISGIEPLTS